MRSKIEANEYKDYILGFIFYKFLSDKQVKFLKEHDWTDEYLPDVTEDDAKRWSLYAPISATSSPMKTCSPHGLHREMISRRLT